jgi:CRP-like cAMP-binding protein
VDLKTSKNLLLQQLSSRDIDRLQPHFRQQSLEFKQTMVEQGKRVSRVYFIEKGVASVITALADGEAIETGTIGNEGLVGLPVVLGASHSPSRVICQIPGRALVVPSAVIATERGRGGPWFDVLLRFVNFVTAMTAQTAACNRLHAVDARMSRWLLMTHDRVDADDFPLTQEFMAQMLGVSRPTVNIAGATLQKAGFIRYTRGRITILDRAGLESATCECYGRIRHELELMVNGHRAPALRRR